MITRIGVVGAGTMGTGIAFCAAQYGFEVILFDANPTVINTAEKTINKNVTTLVEKNKITVDEGLCINKRIKYTNQISDCRADIIIEAIIEKIEAKIELFAELSLINSSLTVFASNTSSLSINNIQAQMLHPERFAGMHFFNPAQMMKLVEVVEGTYTSEKTLHTLVNLCNDLNKTAVVCKDAPGFIVNRVARHYYLEAMKLVELGIANIEQVDTIMETAGFKMGPFKLMDLIGNDINLAVTKSLYEAFENAIRFEPSTLQINKVNTGSLGKKTGRGFYEYKQN